MQGDAADQLHVEMTQSQCAARGLAHHCKGFGQQLIERAALGEPGAELGGLRAQRLIRQCLQHRLQRAGFAHVSAEIFDEPIVAAPKYAGKRL